MTLENLGNLGEFLGAVGVIVTLVYLAVPIRENTRMMRANIRQARAGRGLSCADDGCDQRPSPGSSGEG
jgi:hypothetical protein